MIKFKLMKFAYNYRILIFVPILVLIISSMYLFYMYSTTGEFFKKSIELRGGSIVTAVSDRPVDINTLERELKSRYADARVRNVRSIEGYGVVAELPSDVDIDEVKNIMSGFGIKSDSISFESIGPALGASFWQQSQIAIIIAFVMMGIIVFIVFRTFVPSIAVILSAASDMIVTIALLRLFDIELSLAGLAALLMLIGYSVDTDILLTTRLLKEEKGTIDEKLKRAMKTGLTMTLTTIGAVTALYISSISPVLSQIANVLMFGLIIDLMNTWMQNAGILKWYIESGGK